MEEKLFLVIQVARCRGHWHCGNSDQMTQLDWIILIIQCFVYVMSANPEGKHNGHIFINGKITYVDVPGGYRPDLRPNEQSLLENALDTPP